MTRLKHQEAKLESVQIYLERVAQQLEDPAARDPAPGVAPREPHDRFHFLLPNVRHASWAREDEVVRPANAKRDGSRVLGFGLVKMTLYDLMRDGVVRVLSVGEFAD